jgi:hypothetical protein
MSTAMRPGFRALGLSSRLSKVFRLAEAPRDMSAAMRPGGKGSCRLRVKAGKSTLLRVACGYQK